jgi:preprotein translocase subunit Sss1
MKDYLSDEQIENFAKFSGLMFSPEKIGIMLGLDGDNLDRFITMCNKPLSEEYMIYMKHRLLTEAEIRDTIIANAKNGSKDAQNMAMNYINDINWENA